MTGKGALARPGGPSQPAQQALRNARRHATAITRQTDTRLSRASRSRGMRGRVPPWRAVGRSGRGGVSWMREIGGCPGSRGRVAPWRAVGRSGRGGVSRIREMGGCPGSRAVLVPALSRGGVSYVREMGGCPGSRSGAVQLSETHRQQSAISARLMEGLWEAYAMTDIPNQQQRPEIEDDGDFVRVRFAGGRFDSHTIPFDVLPDLAAYRDLVVEVAKHLFRVRNSDRRRVPKGFEESFQLGLSQIIQGNSATALAQRLETLEDQPTDFAQTGFGFPRYGEFEEARDLLDRVIAAVNDSMALPKDFPRELVGKFNRFGQSLRAGEHAEISHGRMTPVRYDSETRKRIVLSANATYENSLDQRFTLTGGEISTCIVHLVDEDGTRFDLRVDNEEECDKAITRRRHQVRIVGTGLFDRQDRLTKIMNYKELIHTDDEPQQPVEDRLGEIARTPAGWYSGQNPAPDTKAIDRMRELVTLITIEAGVPVPYIYPLPDGSITGEWTRGDWEISATVTLPNLAIELHALNVETNQEFDTEINELDEQTLSAFSIFWNGMDSDGGDQ